MDGIGMDRHQVWALILASFPTWEKIPETCPQSLQVPAQTSVRAGQPPGEIGQEMYLSSLFLCQQIHGLALFSAVMMMKAPMLTWECCLQEQAGTHPAPSCYPPQCLSQGLNTRSSHVILGYPGSGKGSIIAPRPDISLPEITFLPLTGLHQLT